MSDLYSYKGAYPYPLPNNMDQYDIGDFKLADAKPTLQPGEVLEWTGDAWLIRGPNHAEQALKEHDCRQTRNRLLFESDWTQTMDAPVDRSAWAAYRQALRDITGSTGFPWEVTWPTLPATPTSPEAVGYNE